MAENTKIEKTFTYDLPDQYLHQTNNQKKTGNWTYKGPDKLWIFVDKETRKIKSAFHYTERDNGADVPTPEDQYKVLVDANVDPIIASMIHNEYEYGKLPHTEEKLPDNTFYGHPDPLPPDHTYELTEIEYDPELGKFVKPFPWKKPHVSWDDILGQRNGLLNWSDFQYKLATDEEKPAWEVFRQKLRDLPETFKGIDPWKVSMPEHPGQTPRTFTVGNKN